MNRTVELTAAFVLAATLALGGCSDASMPTPPAAEPAFFVHEPAPGFTVIRRDAPLPHDLSVTRIIGPEGGTLDIPEAGVRFVVPADAVLEPTQLTLRALGGSATAFELEPVGLQLAAPARLEVRFADTRAAPELSAVETGTTLGDVLGVSFRGAREGLAEPVGTYRAHRTDDAIVVDLILFLSGYATASG